MVRCGCYDEVCHSHRGRCVREAYTEAYRSDMDAYVSLCAPCLEDALGSGLFTLEPGESEPGDDVGM